MYSLFKVNFNWVAFLLVAILIRVGFYNISWLSYFAIVITLHQSFLLFYSIDYVIPIRYLFGALMCLQMLLGPAFAYNGLDKFQYFLYQMQVPETTYFSYSIPAVIAFIIGLHITAGKLKGETINLKILTSFVDANILMAYTFIIIGFFSSFFSNLFPYGFGFVFVLIGNLKFIGAFMIIVSDTKLKVLPSFIVFTSIIISSLSKGLFHDLLTWLIMFGAIYAIKYKPSLRLKYIFCATFILIALSIQLLKGNYRTAIAKGQEKSLSTLTQAYEQSKGESGFFNFKALASSNVRINQGFIITNIMQTVPNKVPFANGEELRQILEAAFLPRILDPDKLQAGDIAIFSKYSGIAVQSGTTMGLSSVGDAYINFGIAGGCVFMFFLGWFYNEVLNMFHRFSKNYPILILFIPFVFYFPIRPDSELQTNLGHLVKSCFFIFGIFLIWKNNFRNLALHY